MVIRGENICDAFKHDFPALFVHCLHGFGHASMIIGQLFGMSAEQRKTYNGMSIFDRIAVGTASVIVEPKMLDLALNICRGGPSAQLQYICAGGMFMEFWKTRFPGQPVANYSNSSVVHSALHGHEHEAGNMEHNENTDNNDEEEKTADHENDDDEEDDGGDDKSDTNSLGCDRSTCTLVLP